MSDKKTTQKKSNKKGSKCGTKCETCEFYDKSSDFCEARMIKKCSKQKNSNFSTCEDYLVKESLVMF